MLLWVQNRPSPEPIPRFDVLGLHGGNVRYVLAFYNHNVYRRGMKNPDKVRAGKLGGLSRSRAKVAAAHRNIKVATRERQRQWREYRRLVAEGRV